MPEELIKDVDGYIAKEQDNSQLADDVRISVAWWASKQNSDKEIKFTEEEIKIVFKKILAEIAKRKRNNQMEWTASPDSGAYKDLWDEVADETGDILIDDDLKVLKSKEKEQSITEYDEEYIEDLKDLSDDDVKIVYWGLHNIWNKMKQGEADSFEAENIVNYYKAIQKEMKNRGIEKEDKDSLDERAKEIFYSEEQLENHILDELKDDMKIRDMSDEELREYHDLLHFTFKRISKTDFSIKGLAKNHALVIDQMNRIDKQFKEINERKDKLDVKSALYQKEYPEPQRGLESHYTLSEVIDELPEWLFKVDKPEIYLGGGVVNRGEVGENHDVDLIFKSNIPPIHITKRLDNELSEPLKRKIHYVNALTGPSIGWSIHLNSGKVDRYNSIELTKTPENDFDFGSTYTFDTPTELEFIHSLPFIWEQWGEEKDEIVAEPKKDGFHVLVQKDGDNIRLITEQLERHNELKKLSNACKEGIDAETFMGNAEVVAYESQEAAKNTIKPLLRKDFIHLATGEGRQDDTNAVLNFWDVTYVDGEWENELPWKERKKLLRKVINENASYHLNIMKDRIGNDLNSLADAIFEVGNQDDSEGAVLKDTKFKYSFTKDEEETINGMTKFKNLKPLNLKILETHQVVREGEKMNIWNYKCGFPISEDEKKKMNEEHIEKLNDKNYFSIGTTYNTDDKLEVGDLIVAAPSLVKKEKTEKGTVWSWQNPEALWPSKVDTPDGLDKIRKAWKVHNNSIYEKKEDLLDVTIPSEVKEELSNTFVKLQPCPEQNNPKKCPLKNAFAHKFGANEKETPVEMDNYWEVLQFPIDCPLASDYHCPWVKDYYYQFESETNRLGGIDDEK